LLLEKLHEPIHQAASATDHVQSALVLVLFKNSVQAPLKFIHRRYPQLPIILVTAVRGYLRLL
jgi:hypothetical protein